MMSRKDLLIVPVGEGALILAVAAIGWATHLPLIFASLGPTAYELIEKPNSPSAKLYNVILGHLLALGAGFLSLWVLSAWAAPKVMSTGVVSSPRLWAAILSVVITTAVTLMLKASQPASIATALLVSLGSMQTARDAVAIIVGVVIIAAIGEPVRRLRLRANAPS